MNRTFYNVLANVLAGSLTNTFVWFAATFWVYLETRSVIATAIMAGVYTATTALSGFFLGSLVDRLEKKRVMLLSSLGSLSLYGLAAVVFVSTPREHFSDPTGLPLLAFIAFSLFGAIAGNLRTIALSTLVTVLIPEDERDRANGLVGTITGVAFFAASTASGLAIGFLGMFWTLAIAIALTVAVVAHLATLSLPGREAFRSEASQGAGADSDDQRLDVPGTIRVIRAVPGLFGLFFFQTFNNFLGGVFIALMDPYGLSLVSVQVWGTLFGFLSLGFIVGGLVVARLGLGESPLRMLFRMNMVMWTVCIFFTIQPSIVLMAIGMAIWICLVPVIEAAEQTILQKVITPERQGRVFGLAQSIEQAASPVTAFLIGPIAQLIFIPFMTTGAGVDLIGGWFGTGQDRGIALVFSLAGIVGLAVTLLAMTSAAYRRLSQYYAPRRPESAASALG